MRLYARSLSHPQRVAQAVGGEEEVGVVEVVQIFNEKIAIDEVKRR